MNGRFPRSSFASVLRDNRILSITFCLLAVFSVLFGLAVLILAAWRSQPLLAVAGALETYFFFPAWRSLQRLRRDNARLRLLEIEIQRARNTTEEAAPQPSPGEPFPQ
jgi:hypothetical protein